MTITLVTTGVEYVDGSIRTTARHKRYRDKALIGFGGSGSTNYSMVNKIGSTGILATDEATAGTARIKLGGASYGGDRAIFGFGYATTITYTNLSNLVSPTGIVAANITNAQATVRSSISAASYGTDKAIFGFGTPNTTDVCTITNTVSNLGIIDSDVINASATPRRNTSGTGYGGDKALFIHGANFASSLYYSYATYFSNTGVFVSENTGVDPVRTYGTATTFGINKAIIGFGYSNAYLNVTNIVDSLGFIAAAVTTVGTARTGPTSATYGGDKAIFAFGYNGTVSNVSNLVSNTGVTLENTVNVATAREGAAGASFGS